MSERRLYIDPDDDYQTKVLAPAVKADEPFGDEVDVIELIGLVQANRARADGIEPESVPVYVFREGDEVTERFEGGEIPTDHETLGKLADEHGFFDHERGTVVTTREEADE